MLRTKNNDAKRLKDSIITCADIKIKRVVEKVKEGNMMSQRTIGWKVVIKRGKTTIIFRENKEKRLWNQIREEACLA